MKLKRIKKLLIIMISHTMNTPIMRILKRAWPQRSRPRRKEWKGKKLRKRKQRSCRRKLMRRN